MLKSIWARTWAQAVLGTIAALVIVQPAAADTFYASQVVSYVSGAIVDASYNNPGAALGGLNPVTGTFGSTTFYLTPFNSAFLPSDLVEIGPGGSLVLKLAQTASTNGYTIGVHTGLGLLDADFPNGQNTNPATFFNSFLRQAIVQVSANGVDWGNLGLITFNNPSNYYAGAATDPEGLSPGVAPLADPGKPFLGSLSSFDGKDWPGTLATLDGSAGGTWLNLSGITDQNGDPITGVNYISFSVPLDTGSPQFMMLDAVVGTAVPEPTTLILLGMGAPVLIVGRWRRRALVGAT